MSYNSNNDNINSINSVQKEIDLKLNKTNLLLESKANNLIKEEVKKIKTINILYKNIDSIPKTFCIVENNLLVLKL